jgi:hypothetical protein
MRVKEIMEWIMIWVLTNLFGMMWFSGNWLNFLNRDFSGSSYRKKSAGSLIRVRGSNGSVTEVKTNGKVSSHEITSPPGTTVEVRNYSYGTGFTAKGTITVALVLLTIYMSMYVFMDVFRPTMRRYVTEPKLVDQIILIVLIIAYLLNLISLFINRYKTNKQAGLNTVINFIFIGFFLALTIVYILWFMGQLADTKLNLYFPIKYFQAS